MTMRVWPSWCCFLIQIRRTFPTDLLTSWVPWLHVTSPRLSQVTSPRLSLVILQPTSDCRLILASHLATWMIPAIAIISRLFCLQGKRGLFKYLSKSDPLSFFHNMKSAIHVPYAGWLILFCSALACKHDFKNFLSSIQVFCCKTFTMLWYDSSYRCLCVQSSMSSPLHHFSYCHLSVLICLQAPVSLSLYLCTSFSAAPLRIAPLTVLLNVEWRSW